MRAVVYALLLTIGAAAPALAANCVVELSGGYKCDDGTVLKPEAGGGMKTGGGVVLQPDGSGGFRGANGMQLRPNGYGGLTQETAAAPTTTTPQFPGRPDAASASRVGINGYSAPLNGRDCRQDAFGGYRCR